MAIRNLQFYDSYKTRFKADCTKTYKLNSTNLYGLAKNRIIHKIVKICHEIVWTVKEMSFFFYSTLFSDVLQQT